MKPHSDPFIMRTKTIVIAGLVVLAATCGMLLLRGKPQEHAAAGVPAQAAGSGGRSPAQEDAALRDLIAKYSEARVNLAKHAAETSLDLQRSALELGRKLSEQHRSQEKPKNSMIAAESPLGGLQRRFGDTYGELDLSPGQEEEAVAVLLQLFDEQWMEFEEKTVRLEAREDELIRLMLASDACQRKELGEEEYRALLAATDEEMRGMLMPPDEDALGGESSFLHPDFEARFLALLDERQKGVFRGAPERFYLNEGEKREKVPVQPPAMGLDARDKKLTALKKVMELLGGMLE
jgi:hypothetical protein